MKNVTRHTVFVFGVLLFFACGFDPRGTAQEAPPIAFDGFEEMSAYGYPTETNRGLFTIQGQAPITAAIGESFGVRQDTFTVLRLDEVGAVLYSETDKKAITLPLSAVGVLRQRVYVLQSRLLSERRRASMEAADLDVRVVFLYLIAGHILIYGFILTGMLTLPPFRERRLRRRLP